MLPHAKVACGAQPDVCFGSKDPDLRVRLGEFHGNVVGAVGGVVLHHDDLVAVDDLVDR